MENELITIAVQTRERAAIICAKLSDSDIACMLGRTDAHFAPGFAGIKVMVNEMDVENAMEVLNSMEFSDPEEVVDKIITVAISNWQKAELMSEMLAAAGIQSAMINVNMIQPDISAGVKIKVLVHDAEMAISLIQGLEDSEVEVIG